MARGMHDSTVAEPAARGYGSETGLLTRWVPSGLKHSWLYRWFLRLVRVLQLASAAISFGVFTARFYKVYRLVNSVKARRGVNESYGAVEGILSAAVLYTILATLMGLTLKRGRGPTWLRWLWVLLDLAFVGAFIAVAVLTRPHGGAAGPSHCYMGRDATDTNNLTGEVARGGDDDTCDLPWGTFILAIVSTVLHAITAAFHEVRDRYREHRYSKESQAPMVGTTHATQQPMYGQGVTTSTNGHGHGVPAATHPGGVGPTAGNAAYGTTSGGLTGSRHV